MTTPGAPPDGDVSLADVIESVREHARILWRGRWLVVLPGSIAVVVGLTIAITSSPEFTSGMKLLPYRSGMPGGGALSGLAGLAGLRLPIGMADQIITADLYPVIAKTLDFRISVAETAIRFEPGATPITPVAYFQGHRTTSNFIGDLRTSLFNSDTSTPVAFVNGAGNTPMPFYSQTYLGIMKDLDKRLVVTMDRKTSVITIRGTMPTRYAATDFVQTASGKLMHRIIDYEARKAGEQLAFIEEQYQQSRTRYEKAQRNLAEFSDRNRILTSSVSQIERDRLQREFDVEFAVLQQLTTELQQARVKKNQDTPVFTVLEQAVVPRLRTSPRRKFIVMVWGMLGLAIGLARILYAHYRPGTLSR